MTALDAWRAHDLAQAREDRRAWDVANFVDHFADQARAGMSDVAREEFDKVLAAYRAARVETKATAYPRIAPDSLAPASAEGDVDHG